MDRKSEAMSQIGLVILTRLRSALPRECWRMEKRPRAPGRAGDIERSSPRSCCHTLTEVRLCGGLILSNSAYRRSSR